MESLFSLTFAVEILNTETWTDENEESINLGPCLFNINFHYDLYIGYSYDILIAVFDKAAKVCCGAESCWVRTWLYQERKWLAFSIQHKFPVKVQELRDFMAKVSVSSSSGGMTTISNQIVFPPLEFGTPWYFGAVNENISETVSVPFSKWIREWIWSLLLPYIPASIDDKITDAPFAVSDVRHRDAVLCKIQEDTLKRNVSITEEPDKGKTEHSRSSGFGYELSGDKILAGVGRIITFDSHGDQPFEVGKNIILLSSENLPDPSDWPIIFINVGDLFAAPIEEFSKLNITHLYTRWTLGEEIHESEPVDITLVPPTKTQIQFNDSHALPIHPNSISIITASFLDDKYCVQLRGKKSAKEIKMKPKLFGSDPSDWDYGEKILPQLINHEDELDIVIAVTKVNAQSLARNLNAFIRGEYPLYPPMQSLTPSSRERLSTNDTNMLRAPLIPKLTVPTYLILNAQMSLEVSIGVVGCKPPKIMACFSRLYFTIDESQRLSDVLEKIKQINEEVCVERPNAILTGFAIDIGDKAVIFVEGPRDGNILKIWDMTEEFYPKVKPIFHSSRRYSTRIYDVISSETTAFTVLKMYVPLNVILSCHLAYARPALPIPARIAATKLGRILQYGRTSMPSCSEMPTAAELESFKLELCSPLRTYKGFSEEENPQKKPESGHGSKVNPKVLWSKA